MGGTTRLPAWWAPNAPDLNASTSGRSGAPPQDQAGVPRDLRETQPPGQGPYVTANAAQGELAAVWRDPIGPR